VAVATDGVVIGGVPLLIVPLLELSDWKLFHPDGGEASAEMLSDATRAIARAMLRNFLDFSTCLPCLSDSYFAALP
jgi:hypothetical protein